MDDDLIKKKLWCVNISINNVFSVHSVSLAGYSHVLSNGKWKNCNIYAEHKENFGKSLVIDENNENRERSVSIQ